MKRVLSLLLIPFFAGTAHAEDSVTVWGNYYKERSTRVVEPIVRISKDLPYETEAELTYLVDQITSASQASTAADMAFQEYRQEIRLGLQKKFLGMLTPGLNFRVSYEPDYTSLTYGGDVALSLFRDNTILRAYIQHQDDDVRSTVSNFEDTLATTLVGLGVTQVLRKNMVAGLSLEAQFLRGYQENQYRSENHPRERNRYTTSIFAAYELVETETTGRIAYRLYGDNWKLVGHTIELELTQRVVRDLEIAAMLRYYTQDEVYFSRLADGFSTSDPKLFAFKSQLYGLRLSWTLGVLTGTFLEPFASSRIEPSYAFFHQGNSYGDAHMVQLGFHWPF